MIYEVVKPTFVGGDESLSAQIRENITRAGSGMPLISKILGVKMGMLYDILFVFNWMLLFYKLDFVYYMNTMHQNVKDIVDSKC